MKLCIDCAHARASVTGEIDDIAACWHPKNTKTSLVTGKLVIVRDTEFCAVQRLRDDENRCGPSAQWFEPRPVEVAA